MDIAEKITKTIEEALAELGISADGVELEHPADLAHGDFATNVAMVAAKECGKTPRECAETILQRIEQNKPEEVESVSIAGPGFINFHLTREFFVETVSDVLRKGDGWGANESQKGKKIMVEYTDPNPFKVFHIGHLMANTIGESISRLVEFSGAEVKRANYQGDVGLHVAKAIWGKRERPDATWGEAYAYGASQYDAHKEAINAINKELYEGAREEIKKLYDDGRKSSLEHFEAIYAVLGTKFDHYFFESDVWKEGEATVKAHTGDVFEESDGAIVFKGEKFDKTLHTRVFINSEGLPTYEAKELGLAYAKQEAYPFDISITVTANEIDVYFKVVLKALEQIEPDLAAKIRHISHGFMKLPSGKMSSRTGDVIAAEELITDVTNAVLAIESERDIADKEKTAQTIAVGALKYSILKQGTGRDIIYDLKKSLSFEGDSGPYLQYAHTRAQSVLERADPTQGSDVTSRITDTTPLEKLLYRFPEVVARAQNEFEPHHVTTYLTELAAAFNSFYAAEKFIGSTDEAYRLALTRAFQITMKNGLYLLGITAPEKM